MTSPPGKTIFFLNKQLANMFNAEIHLDSYACTSYVTCEVFIKILLGFTAKLREAFLFQVPNSFGIFLITFAILKNPFANPLKKVANLLMKFAMFLS